MQHRNTSCWLGHSLRHAAGANNKLFDTLEDAVLRIPRPVALRPLGELAICLHALIQVNGVHKTSFAPLHRRLWLNELSNVGFVAGKVPFVLRIPLGGCDRYPSVDGTLVETLARLDIESAGFHVPAFLS